MAGFVEKMGGALPGIDLTKLKGVVATAYLHSGVPMPKNDPYVGDDAFTHRGGVHQDGVWKLASYEHVNPEKFGNERVLLLNSLGGRRGVLLAAQKFGHDLDKNSKSVILASKRMLEEVREMEMRGYRCGAMEAEQYLLIEKHFGRLRKFVRVVKPSFSTKKTTKGKEISTFTATFVVDGNRIKDSIEVEGGPIDAAFKSYKRVMSRFYSRASGIHLGDYKVVIANEREEASTVRTEIVLHNGIKRFATVGIDANVLMSALEAINKGFNYYLNVAASKQAEESGAANSH